MVKRTLVAAVFALALGLAAAPSVRADDAQAAQSWAYEAQNELMSPFCPGRTLADCPSPAAESLRLWLVVQQAAGRSRADVEEELFARYGDQMRPAPKAEGFGLTAYLIPLAAFLGGGLLLSLFLRRITRAQPAPAPAAAAPADPELERLVDEELAR
jgi:cytochrome c-type biogenesis protein CcmH/NrfF